MPKLDNVRYSIDCESTGVDFHHGAKPFLVTMTDEEGQTTYWEWEVDPLTREPLIPDSDKREIQDKIDEADNLYLQNPKFDIRALSTVGIDLPWDKVDDTLTAGHLLASNQPHDLTTMALIYLGVNIKPYEDAIDRAVEEARRMVRRKDFIENHGHWMIAKAGLPCMPSAKEKTAKADMWLPRAIATTLSFPQEHPWWTVLSDYANIDSVVTLPLFDAMLKKLEERDLVEIYRMQMQVLPTVYTMESRGLTISKERTYELKEHYLEASQKHEQICLNVADNEIESLPAGGVSNDLKYVIFDKFGLETSKKTKTGGDSMDKYVLEDWLATLSSRSKPYTFVKNLMAYRKRRTALGYIEAYEKFWLPIPEYPDWYVLYSSLNPTGTSTLRFSSSNPNQQQISKQEIHELDGKEFVEGHNARYMFGPGPGREWWSFDANNIELRIPAYEAGETDMIALFERPNDPPYFGSNHLFFFDILHPEKFAEHGANVKKVFASSWYQWTKNGDFAVQYGAVAESGTADRAYHVKNAQAKIESKLTNIKKLSVSCIAHAEKYGYVETVPDKTVNPRRGYPLLCTRTKWGGIMPTVPLSYHVQGTAMWWMKKAMIRCQAFLDTLNKDERVFKSLMKRPKTISEKKGGYHISLQVHDELVFDFPRGNGADSYKTNLPIARRIKQLMEQGGDDISIPTPVGCEYHPDSWGKGESIKL